MRKLPLLIAAFAAAGFTAIALAPQGQAQGSGGYYQDDYYGPKPKRGYGGPDSYGPSPYAKPRRKKDPYGGRCAATIRAVGKRNLIGGFARNSAIFAWQREAKHVHGERYGDWGLARNPNVECDKVKGALKRCVATGRPCHS